MGTCRFSTQLGCFTMSSTMGSASSQHNMRSHQLSGDTHSLSTLKAFLGTGKPKTQTGFHLLTDTNLNLQPQVIFFLVITLLCLEGSTQNTAEPQGWNRKQQRHQHSRLWQKVEREVASSTYPVAPQLQVRSLLGTEQLVPHPS